MLTEEQKHSLNNQIDGGIPVSLPFADRKGGLLHILRSAEFRKNGVDEHFDLYGPAIAETTLDVTREALHHCLSWIHEKVPISAETDNSMVPKTTETDLRNCLALLQTAAAYSEICDVMTMLWLDRVEIKHHGDDDIELAYTREQIEFEAAQWLWRLNYKEIPAPRDALNDLQRWINAEQQVALDESILFKIPIEILSKINARMTDHSANLWQLPEALDLESFTTDDFKPYWTALMTLAVVPRVLFNATKDLHVSIPVGKRECWIELLTNLSGVDSTKVSTMFDLLTYSLESTTTGGNRRKADSISQPIFQIDTDLFAISSMYILMSNAERNLFDLASAKLPRLYDKRKDEKERQWSEDLAFRFRDLGHVAVPQRKYGNGAGDLDVFVYDRSTKLGLIIQLKWLLLDRIKSRNLRDANECMRQAREAITWIADNPEEASDLLRLTREEIVQGTFLPLAVLKDGLLNGFATSLDVPLLSGNIFDDYITKYGGDLHKLWKVAHERRFLPIRDYHYVLGDFGYVPAQPFNGIRFKRRRILPKEPWIPWFDVSSAN